MGRVRSVVAVAGLSVFVAALLVPDDGGKPAPSEPQVQTSIELDKRVYAQGETVSARVTVTNDGPVSAERVVLNCVDAAGNTNYPSTNYLAGGEDWLRLTVRRPQALTLAPSESFTTRVSGVVSPSAANVGTMGILCGVTYDGSAKKFVLSQIEAAVTGASNAVTGRFTICQDLGAAGVRLTLERDYDGTGETPPGPWSTVTDSDGRFAFPVVAAGRYVLWYEPPPGYAPAHLPDAIDLLVAADGLRWQGELTVTPTDPATRCEN